jgi:pimeloyl-ACP methyl ester carboxylesterase
MHIPDTSNGKCKNRMTSDCKAFRPLDGGRSRRIAEPEKYTKNTNELHLSTSTLTYIQSNEYNLYSTSIETFANSLKMSQRYQSISLQKQKVSNNEYLFRIPESLFPTYQQPTSTTCMFLIVASVVLSLSTTVPLQMLLSPEFWTENLTHTILVPDLLLSTLWKTSFPLFIEIMACKALLTALWQEMYLQPSRISTTDLASKHYLPTAISNYQTVELYDKSSHEKPIGVHWIEYENKKSKERSTTDSASTAKADVVFFNHGYGSSSLSWLPSIQKVTDLFGAQFGLGHDAVGFGFTDRPKKVDCQEKENNNFLRYFTTDYSAEIAVSLIMSRLAKIEPLHRDNLQNTLPHQPTYFVVLFGHSLGAITTLRTAKKLQKVFNEKYKAKDVSLKIQIYLVAPALGFTNIHENASSAVEPAVGMVCKKLFEPIMSHVGRGVLRRAVGTPNFWKRGLVLAWGDKSRLSDSDVLRHQWPSIVEGWEEGLMNFATAHHSKAKLPKNQDGTRQDEDLLHSVLAMPEVIKTSVILGGRDKVVSAQKIRKLLSNFPTVTIRQLDNSGHDPFEEEVDLFVDTVNKLREGVHGS